MRRRSYRQKARGQSPLIDAAPVREHIDKLCREYGLGLVRIAVLAGLSDTALRAIMGRIPSKPAHRVRLDTAEKLLAVAPTLDDLAPYTPVNACGTRRRIQALVAAGRLPIEIAEHVGGGRGTVLGIMNGLWPTVRAETARAVRGATTQLWDQPVPVSTPEERRRATTARNLAKRNGWVVFAAWEDIDNPNATPEVDAPPIDEPDPHLVDAAIAGRVSWASLTRLDADYVVGRLRRLDRTNSEVAELLGCTAAEVAAAAQRVRARELRAARKAA